MGDQNLPIEWAVKIDDETIKTSDGVEVMQIEVDLENDKIDMCTITFNDTPKAVLKGARHKLEYDLYYAKNYTPFLDLLILIQTARVILWPEGAR